MATQQQTAKPASVVPSKPPTLTSATPEPSITTVVAPPETPKTLQDLLEKFVVIKELTDPSSHFTHEGVCGKCGWHTMQISRDAAMQLLRQHVQTHWKDVSAQVQR